MDTGDIRRCVGVRFGLSDYDRIKTDQDARKPYRDWYNSLSVRCLLWFGLLFLHRSIRARLRRLIVSMMYVIAIINGGLHRTLLFSFSCICWLWRFLWLWCLGQQTKLYVHFSTRRTREHRKCYSPLCDWVCWFLLIWFVGAFQKAKMSRRRRSTGIVIWCSVFFVYAFILYFRRSPSSPHRNHRRSGRGKGRQTCRRHLLMLLDQYVHFRSKMLRKQISIRIFW